MDKSKEKPLNRNIIVGLLIAAAFVTILNQTLLLIAITPVMNEFGITASQAQWMTTAFLLTNGILIPVSAFLIEKFTSRALLISALAIFTLGTLIGALADHFSVLLTARIIQAGGAGIMMPLMQTVLLSIFPVEKRGAAMGMVGLVMSFAPAVGPTVSGWVLDHFTWRYLFYIILPIALIVLTLAILFMRNVTVQKDTKIDIPSVILSSFGWGGLLFGFSMVGSAGWLSRTVILSILIGAVSLVFFIRRQFQLERPMLEFRVFQSRVFSLTTILAVIVFALMIGIQTLIPIYTQDLRHISALHSGLILLPGALVMGIMSPIIGRIFDKIGGRGLAITGFSLMLLATVLLLNIKMNTPPAYISFVFVILMLGIAMNFSPLMTAAMNALPNHLIPHGTAMNNTIRMVGGSIGTALLVSIMSSTAAKTMDKQPLPAAMLDGMLTAFIAAGVMAFIGFLISFTLKRKEEGRKQPAHSGRGA